MASLGLYELSPFSGDHAELVAPSEGGVYDGQDGSLGFTIKNVSLTQGHQLEPSSPQHGLLDPVDYSWMDSSIDLLQFLTGEEVAPLEPLSPPVDRKSISEADSAIAAEILKSVAEDTTKMLDSGGDPSVPETSDPEAPNVDWFDMLDDEVTQVLSNVVTLDTAPVLSPVSAEDIESILSSGSPSPSPEENEHSIWSQDTENTIFSPGQEDAVAWVSLPSEASHMILVTDQSIVDESMASSFSDTEISSDLMDESMESSFSETEISPDLTQLLAQVEKHPSCGPVSLTTKAENKSRPKPYSRKTKADKRVDTDIKILDRKERKKQQNKDAALRYRLKKKQESSIIDSEISVLETRNTTLKSSVEQMTREISYLKNLLAEVYKTKELMKSQ